MARHEHHVGSFEAKTKLSQLLRRVQDGEEFVIQVRGKPAARLVPYVPQPDSFSWSELTEIVAKLRSQVGETVSVRELLNEGRKL